ncbi:unnamed protein product [Effrenium voratum]|nr:unnamed protein product [Effrenium voratum]
MRSFVCALGLSGVLFCGFRPEQHRRPVARRARGYLLLNTDEMTVERFVLKRLLYAVDAMELKELTALDWQPRDARGTRYLNNCGPRCVQYYAAGLRESWVPGMQKDFLSRGSRDEKVPVRFLELPRLDAEKGSVDIALLQPDADFNLRKDWRQVFRETWRLLKPNRRFLVFTEAKKKWKLPEAAEDFFEMEKRYKRDNTRCFQLLRKARKRPKPEPEPLPEKPRQKKVKQQGITVDELQDILGEEDENEEDKK